MVDIAELVTLVHRRDDFRAAPNTVSKMWALFDAGRVTLHIGQLKGLEGSDGVLQNVLVQQAGADAPDALAADVLPPFYGLTTKVGPIADFGPNL